MASRTFNNLIAKRACLQQEIYTIKGIKGSYGTGTGTREEMEARQARKEAELNTLNQQISSYSKL